MSQHCVGGRAVPSPVVPGYGGYIPGRVVEREPPSFGEGDLVRDPDGHLIGPTVWQQMDLHIREIVDLRVVFEELTGFPHIEFRRRGGAWERVPEVNEVPQGPECRVAKLEREPELWERICG